jgi:hypothetical protein
MKHQTGSPRRAACDGAASSVLPERGCVTRQRTFSAWATGLRRARAHRGPTAWGLLGLLIASTGQAAIVVTDTGASSGGTCTLAQAIYAANRANNPANATPVVATTIAPLSESAATVAGIGTCAGAATGQNTIELPAAAAISFDTDAPDNFWYGPNALPPIASTITIEGRGATLSVGGGVSPRLRFFFVGADPQSSATPGYNTPGPGNLTLRNLSVHGGVQRGGRSKGGGAGAGLGGAIYNQGSLTLSGVTLSGNQAIGGGTVIGTADAGGGMATDGSGGGGAMGGVVPKGTGDAGLNGNGPAGLGGAGGGVATGLAGAGSHNSGGTDGPAGNGGGGGGGSGPNSAFYNAGGGGGFGGGPGGLSERAGVTGQAGAGSFANGALGGSGGGGGVGSGGAGSGQSIAAGGGGFGGGGGSAFLGGKGGFGGGGGAGGNGTGGFGGGNSFPHQAAHGGGGAGMGGAVFNHAGQVTLINSTLTGNVATGGRSGTGARPDLEGTGGSGLGGAVFNLNGTLTVRFSTIAGNTVAAGAGNGGSGSAAGGAIYSLAYTGANGAGSATAALTLHNSILSNSIGGTDLVVDQPAAVSGGLGNTASATTAAAGANLVMSATAANNAPPLPAFPLIADPLLGALTDNGGPADTMALVPGSPAIDAAEACGGPLPAIDQRGFGRVTGVAPDLGAYEFDAVEIDVVFSDGFEAAVGCP